MNPIKLELRNFRCFNNLTINFDPFNVALIIGEEYGNVDISNGVGKSTIFEGLTWVLFNKSKSRTIEKVIKIGKTIVSGTFIFMKDGEKFKVTRRMSRKNNASEVLFYKKTGKSWTRICEDGTPSLVTKTVIQTIGAQYDTFLNSTYFKQDDITKFADASPSERKEILKEALHINIWDKYQSAAKAFLKDFKIRKVLLDKRVSEFADLDEEALGLIEQQSDAEENMEISKDSIEQLEEELSGCRNQLSKLLSSGVDNSSNQYNIHVVDKKQLLKDLEQVTKKINFIKDAIKKNNSKIAKISQSKADLSRKMDKAQSGKFVSDMLLGDDQLQKQIVDCTEELDKAKEHLTKYKLQLKQLDFLQPGKQCPTCLSDFEELDSVVVRRKNKKEYLESQIDKSSKNQENKEKELSSVIALNKKTKKIISDIDKAKLVLSKYVMEEEFIHKDNEKFQINLSNLISKKEVQEKSLLKIRELIKDCKVFKDSQDKIDNLRACEESIEANISVLHEELLERGIDLGSIKAKIEENNRLKSERVILLSQQEDLKEETRIYKYLVKSFGKDGVPAIIVENITQELRQFANQMLEKVCHRPTSIDFITQKKNDNGSWGETFEIIVTMDGTEFELRDLSGGEKIRISIAIRLAISHILTRRMGSGINFLLLDEVDQSLDKHGVESLAGMIHLLSGSYKILIITHNDIMKEKFSNIITVRRNKGQSIILQ
jgi:exonuclease SbcC